jgi:O-succinylbenzoate synthase
MDHPIGVAHALAIASELKKSHPQRILDAGCMTLRLFQMEAYSAEMITTGPYIKRAAGKGIGFDLLLMKEPWAHLKIR